jgi:hypothetical protein
MARIHNERAFTSDHAYIRRVLAQAGELRRAGKWGECAELYRELSGVLGNLEALATDEFYGVPEAYCEGLDEVNSNDDIRRAEAQREHREKVIADLEHYTAVHSRVGNL